MNRRGLSPLPILKADCGFGLDDSKSSDALLLRCSDAEVGQDRASGVDRVPLTFAVRKSILFASESMRSTRPSGRTSRMHRSH